MSGIASHMRLWSPRIVFALALGFLLQLAAVSARAQGQQAAAPKPSGSPTARAVRSAPVEHNVAKVVHVKYADVDRLSRLLIYFGVSTRPDSTLKVIAISGPPSRVSTAEEAIHRLDVPPPPAQDVFITAYLLMSTRRPADSNYQPGEMGLPPGMPGANLPSSLAEVVNQLRGVLGYRDFRLVHTLTLRMANGGGADISGVTPIGTRQGNPGVPNRVEVSNVDFRVDRARIVPEQNAGSVSLTGLRLVIFRPNSGQTAASISTDIDVGANQQVVVGKTDVFSPDLALFLVLSANIVN